MTIQEVFQKHSEAISRCMVDEEEGIKELEEFHKEFNNKFTIVPKEQYGVIFHSPWEGDQPALTGPFDSEKEAKLFIDKWYEKREEAIKERFPNEADREDLAGPNLIVKKLEFSKPNQDLIDEIRKGN